MRLARMRLLMLAAGMALLVGAPASATLVNFSLVIDGTSGQAPATTGAGTTSGTGTATFDTVTGILTADQIIIVDVTLIAQQATIVAQTVFTGVWNGTTLDLAQNVTTQANGLPNPVTTPDGFSIFSNQISCLPANLVCQPASSTVVTYLEPFTLNIGVVGAMSTYTSELEAAGIIDVLGVTNTTLTVTEIIDTPEPGTMLLLGTGLAGLLLSSRRRA